MTPIFGNVESFEDFTTKPQKRKALQIKPEHNLRYDKWETRAVIETESGTITFAAYNEPSIGDYVVYLNSSDIYHCPEETFNESHTKE